MSSPVGVAVVLAGGVLAVDAGGTDDGPGFCVFRRCTGGYCPGCGLSRSARHLMRGDVGAAWMDHPWMVLLVVQVTFTTITWAVARGSGRRVDWARPIQLLAIGNAVALLVIWIVRMVDGSIPTFY